MLFSELQHMSQDLFLGETAITSAGMAVLEGLIAALEVTSTRIVCGDRFGLSDLLDVRYTLGDLARDAFHAALIEHPV
jgi:hypothetical protein